MEHDFGITQKIFTQKFFISHKIPFGNKLKSLASYLVFVIIRAFVTHT